MTVVVPLLLWHSPGFWNICFLDIYVCEKATKLQQYEEKYEEFITSHIKSNVTFLAFKTVPCSGNDGTLYGAATLGTPPWINTGPPDRTGETDGEGRDGAARGGRSASAIRAANKEQIELLMTGSRVPIDEPVKRQPHDHLHTRDNTPRKTMRLNFLAGWSAPAALLPPSATTPSLMLPPPYPCFNLKRA